MHSEYRRRPTGVAAASFAHALLHETGTRARWHHRPSVRSFVRPPAQATRLRSLFLSLTSYGAHARVYLRGRHEEQPGRPVNVLSAPPSRYADENSSEDTTPCRTSLPFLTSLTPPIIPLVLSLSSSSSPSARQRWWRSPVVGARRIGEYRESKTEATRFRRTFFLVSRASLTGAARKLRASPCARMSSSFHHPTFGKRLPLSLPLVQTLPCLFPLTLPRIAHPCVRPCLVIPRYAMPRHATPLRTVSSLSRSFRSQNLACNRIFSCIRAFV